MRAVPVLLVAVLLALSPPTMAMVASGPADGQLGSDAIVTNPNQEPVNGTTSRLGLTGERGSTYATPAADLGTTLAGQDESMRADYVAFALENDFDSLPTDEKRAAIETSLQQLEERIDSVERRERTAITRHANDEIGDRTLLRTFVRNYRESIELQRTLDALDEHADTVPGYSISEDPYTVRLEAFQSPGRERLEKSLRGLERADRSPDIVYLETSEDGYELATIDNRRYVREVVRYDNRDIDGEETVDDIGVAIDRLQELYPTVLGTDENGPTYRPYTSIQLYTASVTHPQGVLEASLDGATGNVFRESQQLRLDRLPHERVGTWQSDGLELSINRTPANGPIELTIVDSRTGDPVDATVEVDGYPIGNTDDRETMWLIPPASDYDVTVREGERTVNATITEAVNETDNGAVNATET